MLHVRTPRVAVLVALCALALPAPSSAQITRMLKKKIKEVVKGDSAANVQKPGADQAKPATGPTFNDYVLRLDAENLDRFHRGLTARKAFRDSVDRFYAALPTPEKYQACQLGVMQSPEAQTLAANRAEGMAGMQKNAEALQALMLKRCGRDPASYRKTDDMKHADEVAAHAAGMEPAQFGIATERVVAFCRGGGEARVPGETKGLYYVFAEDEVATLKPQCARLMGLLGPEYNTSLRGGDDGSGGPKYGGDPFERSAPGR